MSPRFLKLDEVFAIHGRAIARQEFSQLRFAIGAVESKFHGAFFHETVHEMAAAYLFYMGRNGNKRTALACALAFLRLNDKKIVAPPDDLYDLVIGVAEGKVTKAAVAVFFEEHA